MHVPFPLVPVTLCVMGILPRRRSKIGVRDLCGNAFFLAAADVAIDGGWSLLVIFLVIVILITSGAVLGSWHPHAGLPIGLSVHGLILVGKINTIASDTVLAALR